MYEQGEGPGGEPQALIGGFADQIGAMLLAFGVVNALFVHERDGIGQHVDCSLIGGMVAMQSKQIYEYLRSGKQSGFQRRRAATYTNYECADGLHVAIAANTEEFWDHLCDGLDSAWLKTDERFADPWGRSRNKDALVDELDKIFKTRPRDAWLQPLEKADVHTRRCSTTPACRNTRSTGPADAGLDGTGPHRSRHPDQMSETPPRIQGPAPSSAAYPDILLNIGYTWEEIDQLKAPAPPASQTSQSRGAGRDVRRAVRTAVHQVQHLLRRLPHHRTRA